MSDADTLLGDKRRQISDWVPTGTFKRTLRPVSNSTSDACGMGGINGNPESAWNVRPGRERTTNEQRVNNVAGSR